MPPGPSAAVPHPLRGFTKLAVVGQGAFGVCSVYQKPRDELGPPKKVLIKSVLVGGGSGTMETVVSECILLKLMSCTCCVGSFVHCTVNESQSSVCRHRRKHAADERRRALNVAGTRSPQIVERSQKKFFFSQTPNCARVWNVR